MKIKTLAFLAAVLAVSSQARDQIKIVGSSTVYPFSSYVAEELGVGGKFPTPVVESTGSGGGFKLFCAGNGLDTPDFSNASRAMKTKELELCEKNGVKNITGVMIGYDGITIAQSKSNKDLALTKQQLFLAVAQKVEIDGKLVDNPYKNWDEIDASLPKRPIVVYGPPTSSGTRDAFEELVMQKVTKKSELYKELVLKSGKKKFKGYDVIRQDGVYVPSGENDNLIVQKLEKDTNAIGIFGYSFLAENADKIKAAKVDNELPTPQTIADGSYPVSRSLYFYVKNDHLKDVPAMDAYMKLFLSDKMIGEDGVLKTIGLIPMSSDLRKKVQASALAYKPLTADMVKARKVVE